MVNFILRAKISATNARIKTSKLWVAALMAAEIIVLTQIISLPRKLPRTREVALSDAAVRGRLNKRGRKLVICLGNFIKHPQLKDNKSDVETAVYLGVTLVFLPYSPLSINSGSCL